MRTAILASGMTLGLLSFASAMPAAFPFPPPPRTVQIHGCHPYYAHDLSGWHRHEKGLRPPRLYRRQEPKRCARLKGASFAHRWSSKSRSTCEDNTWHLSQPRLKANCRSFVIGARQPASRLASKIFEVPGFLWSASPSFGERVADS